MSTEVPRTTERRGHAESDTTGTQGPPTSPIPNAVSSIHSFLKYLKPSRSISSINQRRFVLLTSDRKQLLIRLGILAFALVVGGTAFFTLMPKFIDERSVILDGCFDSTTGAYTSLFQDKSESVNRTSEQCLAIVNMALEFGFLNVSAANCVQNTTIAGPKSDSFLNAQFCDPNTVVSVRVDIPPEPVNQLPGSLTLLSNLQSLTFSNALFGDQILSPLFDFLAVPKYFQSLNMSGSPLNVGNDTLVLNGTIPNLPEKLISLNSKQFFVQLLLANNNLTGTLPATLGDTITLLSVENNTLLSGPLPNTVAKSNANSPWTQSWRCEFANTSLCVPPSWSHQPSCLRSSNETLPTCDTTSPEPHKEIDPKDPYLESQARNSPDLSGVFKLMAIMFGSSFLVFLVVGVFVHYRRLRYGDMDGDSDNFREEGREVYDLPAYTPPVVVVAEAAGPPPPPPLSPISLAPSYHSMEPTSLRNTSER